ncbi:hypothetical protein JCM9140_911 [Halalkalibacter wakoensis JCM 9140]|uniref:Uncharacterized protein n=1 Tax=Halalkalibacter wakoensis JCM 9140 TaxID=1236970 RepID=W4PZ61_9BACI|nr:hypothetical protein [Halalkalibacter wakoensis]GAE24945.1 hypothetical protein JCM9140_911 [Halalkalibacter wakoensis JCM 9140]
MSEKKVLTLLGFFFVNGLFIGSIFTGLDYLMEVLLFTVVANVIYVGLLFYLKRNSNSLEANYEE